MKKRKLAIHIGYPKTATTTLQKTCADNAGFLKNHGVLYPMAGRLGFNHPLFASTIKEPEYARWVPPAEDSVWQRLSEEVAASSCGRVLISTENFAVMKKIDKLAGFIDKDWHVEIVVFLREQSEWIESHYNQLYRQNRKYKDIRFAISRPRFLEQLDYEAALKPWDSVFGTENIHVIPFAGGASRRTTMFAKFLAILGIDDPAFLDKFVGLKSNEALPPVCIEFMHRLCEPGEHSLYSRLDHYCARYASEVVGKTVKYGRLTGEERKGIRKRYAPLNANVARKYLGADVLFDDEAREEEYAPYPRVSDAEIAELERWVMHRLIKEARDARWKRRGRFSAYFDRISSLIRRVTNRNQA